MPGVLTALNAASFVRCGFHNNGEDDQEVTIILSNNGAPVRIQGCRFTGKSTTHRLFNANPSESSDVFFSDQAVVVGNTGGQTTQALTLSEARGRFLTADDPRLLTIYQVHAHHAFNNAAPSMRHARCSHDSPPQYQP